MLKKVPYRLKYVSFPQFSRQIPFTSTLIYRTAIFPVMRFQYKTSTPAEPQPRTAPPQWGAAPAITITTSSPVAGTDAVKRVAAMPRLTR